MSNNIILNNSFPLINNFENYKKFAISIPAISDKEERILLEELINNNSLESAKKLILSQLKTVIFIAKQFKNYGMSEEDLVQEGNVGLMKAVKNYNLNYQVRLYSYSILWIKSEIQNYILKNWKMVKIGTTKNLKKLFFNFRKTQKEMIDLGVPKNKFSQFLSEKLGVSKEEINEIDTYFSNDDVSIDLNDNDDNPILQIKDNKTPEKLLMISHDAKVRENVLISVLDKLNDRQKEVINLRFFNEEKKTHKEISELLGVSSERIRQIESESVLKMKKILKKDYNITEIF